MDKVGTKDVGEQDSNAGGTEAETNMVSRKGAGNKQESGAAKAWASPAKGTGKRQGNGQRRMCAGYKPAF